MMTKMTFVTTHRGLDPDKGLNYPKESSLEAFRDQLNRGYGLEFDVRFSKDNVMIVIHDANLKRITNGADERAISNIDSAELLAMDFEGSHLTTIPDLLALIKETGKGRVSAMHLKAASQQREYLNTLLPYLADADPETLILFDVTLETAKYLKEKNPNLALAPSVAHLYDIERYNGAVGGTLYSVDEVLQHRELFDWVWLDEWDLRDAGGGEKKFYSAEVFEIFRKAGMKIGLVTPELHGTSPGLLGGEAHPDAKPDDQLYARIKEILNLKPDLVCTDHPDRVQEFLLN